MGAGEELSNLVIRVPRGVTLPEVGGSGSARRKKQKAATTPSISFPSSSRFKTGLGGAGELLTQPAARRDLPVAPLPFETTP